MVPHGGPISTKGWGPNPITHVLISLCCGPHSSSGKWKWSDAVSASWLVKTRLQALKSPFGSFKLALTFAEPLMVAHWPICNCPMHRFRCIGELHYAKFDLKIVFIQKKLSCHFILFFTKFTFTSYLLLQGCSKQTVIFRIPQTDKSISGFLTFRRARFFFLILTF